MPSPARSLRRLAARVARYGHRHGAAGLARRLIFEFRRLSQGRDYRAWIKTHLPAPDELARQRADSESPASRPVFSFITPVYDTPLAVLRDTIESVLAQTYPHWELCLADGGSTRAGVKDLLEYYAARDSRVRVGHLDSNLGISGNSNAALALARGEFLVLLDHDDMVAPDHLYEVAALLQERPDADVIYYDEDKVSADGRRRHAPFFKPHTWSPELLLSGNYLMHSVLRRRLVEDLGGFDSGVDGAQDWDLLFRCTERTDRIFHVPKVLYHWRQVSGSTAASLEAKAGVVEAQRRSLTAHARRQGLADAGATLHNAAHWQLTWTPSRGKVSIVIPTRDKARYLRRCLSSLWEKTGYADYEIILVDTGSADAETHRYYETLREDARVKLVDGAGPFNFSAANNLGARHATGDLLLFLNNDVEILEAEWLEEMVRWAQQPEIGLVGAHLLYPNGSVQHAGLILGMFGGCAHVFLGAPEFYFGCYGPVESYRNFSAVTGACQMMRREVYEEVGGFDESYALVFGDVQICQDIIGRGLRVLCTPFARLRHHEGRTRATAAPAADLLVARRKMGETIERGDNYFNPNLSYWSHLPRVALGEERSRTHHLPEGAIENEADSARAEAARYGPGPVPAAPRPHLD